MNDNMQRAGESGFICTELLTLARMEMAGEVALGSVVARLNELDQRQLHELAQFQLGMLLGAIENLADGAGIPVEVATGYLARISQAMQDGKL